MVVVHRVGAEHPDYLAGDHHVGRQFLLEDLYTLGVCPLNCY